jgi:hypothetical protein
LVGHQWLTLVILATLEADIKRIHDSKAAQANSSARPYLKTLHKKGLVECPWVQFLVLKKKRKIKKFTGLL